MTREEALRLKSALEICTNKRMKGAMLKLSMLIEREIRQVYAVSIDENSVTISTVPVGIKDDLSKLKQHRYDLVD